MAKTNKISFLNSIAAQLLILLVLAFSVFIVSLFVTVSLTRRDFVDPPIAGFTERQKGMAEILAQTPLQERLRQLDRLKKRYPDVTLVVHSQTFELPDGLAWNNERDDFMFGSGPPRDLWRGPKRPDNRPVIIEPFSFARSIEELKEESPLKKGDSRVRATLYFQMPDGQVISSSRKIRLRTPPNMAVDTISFFVVICMILLMIWAIYFLIIPIRRLAQVTDKIGKDNSEPQLAAETGPSEVRLAARALNKMQDRIHHLIEDRTRMLAAVGHDLRTPVTRLRLRADVIEPDDVKNAFLRDLDMMDGLLSRLMIYFRRGDAGDEMASWELSSLIDSLVSEWSDSGYDVSIIDMVPATIKAHPNELLRMVDNLVDNAIKYAGSCALQLVRDETHVCLKVIDHGPGIPLKDKALLQEPFARGDKARTMNETSGFGLGLAIALNAAVNHNAEMILDDTPGGGLTVVVRIPLAE
ncbi:ATP-binding protein [Cohaesibacter celericrescens]|uniref:ATP-binding protein n=1 Tax=Cohaesibacter celericrescens TaxID=2067669 RepID=UPI003564EC25